MKPSNSLLNNFSLECQACRQQGFSIFGLHQDSIVLAVSDDAVQDLGYSADEMLGMNAWKLFDPSSFAKISSQLFSGQSSAYDVTAVRKDGSRFDIHMDVFQTECQGETVRLVAYKPI